MPSTSSTSAGVGTRPWRKTQALGLPSRWTAGSAFRGLATQEARTKWASGW